VTDPTDLRFDVPHSARVWNYWLGGKDNFPADREVGDKVAALHPEILVIARQARQFLHRAVSFLAGEAGIEQFLDIGTGLPTMQNTHEVAQRIQPAASIVYVDNDPLVLTYANALLTNVSPEGRTAYVHADVREPEQIIAQAGAQLDFSRPVAVMLLGILGHATPEFADMLQVVRTLMAAVPSGSYLALQDGSNTSETVRAGAEVYNGYVLRSPDEFRQCFAGLDLVEPGVVSTPFWRPEPTDIGAPQHIDSYGGVGRKP
jgi:O-methyltransferase involved in polyketide biosynthesis